MFGTIRKHSKWLWGIVITLTIISFVVWTGPGNKQNGPGTGNLGSISGVRITADDYQKARREAQFYYLFQRGNWPDRNFDIEQLVYQWLAFIQKQESFGIYVDTETVAKVANARLQMLNRGTPVPIAAFEKEHLTPRGLTLDDMDRYFRHWIGLQEMMRLGGLSGELVAPDEIRTMYAAQFEEYTAQAAFFMGSNYLSGVTVTPAAVAQFFTNHMVEYRIPERLRVSYLKFPISNHLAEVTKFFGDMTNFTQIVEANYNRAITENSNAFPEAKTPEEGKARVRERIFKQQMTALAQQKANDIASQIYDINPQGPENLELYAKTNNLKVEVSAPFAAHEIPKGLDVGIEFADAAFALPTNEPFAGPLIADDAVYIISLKQRLPSENPVFENVREKVTKDYQNSQGAMAARAAGEAFQQSVTNGLAAGKTFAAIAAENKVKLVSPPPVSRATRELPQVESMVRFEQFLNVVFLTPVGKASPFIPTREGGFVVFVDRKLPLDEAKMRANLPGFTRAVQQSRQGEAFGDWINQELGRALVDTPLARRQSQMSGAPDQ